MKIKITPLYYNSRFNSPEQLLSFMSNIDYKEFDKLMDSQEVADEMLGSCHDQVMLEYDELSRQGFNPLAKFIIAVDNLGQGYETHSFVYYEYNDKFYWIENAWEDYRGIREFDTEDGLLNYVISTFANRNPDKSIYLSEFSPKSHRIGENLQQLVDTCLNSVI